MFVMFYVYDHRQMPYKESKHIWKLMRWNYRTEQFIVVRACSHGTTYQLCALFNCAVQHANILKSQKPMTRLKVAHTFFCYHVNYVLLIQKHFLRRNWQLAFVRLISLAIEFGAFFPVDNFLSFQSSIVHSKQKQNVCKTQQFDNKAKKIRT